MASRPAAPSWIQRVVTLSPKRRGCHMISDEVLKQIPEITHFEVGSSHFFIQHTSASLTLNENADPDVRVDMETSLNRLVPEDAPYRHSDEGPDDMPAHVECKSPRCERLSACRQRSLAPGYVARSLAL